jgi:DNA-directed RNA polymerase specialized sigma24 family protein
MTKKNKVLPLVLPPSVTEAQFLAAVEKIVNILSPSFAFGYFTVEDIKQQARMFAIEAMQRYDPTRPLDNFLYAHVKNRLINFRRDKFRRNDPPCLNCHSSLPGDTAHENKQYCSAYLAWLKRNCAKQNLMSPLDISSICDEHEPTTRTESSVVEDIERRELLAIIDLKLPVELRGAYLQMQSGETVPKIKRLAVEKAVLEIVKDNVACLTN